MESQDPLWMENLIKVARVNAWAAFQFVPFLRRPVYIPPTSTWKPIVEWEHHVASSFGRRHAEIVQTFMEKYALPYKSGASNYVARPWKELDEKIGHAQCQDAAALALGLGATLTANLAVCWQVGTVAKESVNHVTAIIDDRRVEMWPGMFDYNLPCMVKRVVL